MAAQRKWRALLLFGMPGSGKGTQGAALSRVPGYLHIGTGELFRNLEPGTRLYDLVHSYTDRGQLVPDELAVDIWRDHMDALIVHGKFDPKNDILLLDGIPRTFHQAEMIESSLEVQKILYLMLPDVEVAIDRIHKRKGAEHRVDDDNRKVIRHRIKTFREETARTLAFYDPQLVAEIDASLRPMQVLHEITNVICHSPAETKRK